MGLNLDRPKAILFDFGNTLIPFGRLQLDAVDGALTAALVQRFGHVDRARLKAIRDADRLAPFANGFRENDLVEVCTGLVRKLYGVEPGQAVIDDLLRARFDAFVRAIEAPEYLSSLLDRLSRRYRLALVSNYPDPKAIRTSLERIGLARVLASVVVSGDVGFVKPHPLPFQRCLAELRLQPDDVIYVGDNWLADVQGPKRLGMPVIWTTQWEAVDNVARDPGDLEPDLTIRHLTDLEHVLL